jgi:hypothetical protein
MMLWVTTSEQIIIKEDGLIMGNCKLRIGNGEIMVKNGALSMWWGMMMDDGLMIIKNGK